MDTGIKIKVLREKERMSQQELATRLGISQSTLHRIETIKDYKIDISLINKLSDIFRQDITYFTKP